MEILARLLLILLFCLILIASGCQKFTEKEYYENGNIKKEINREGVPNWSEKHISYK